MTVPAEAVAALEVVQAEAVLELAVVVLNSPSDFGGSHSRSGVSAGSVESQ